MQQLINSPYERGVYLDPNTHYNMASAWVLATDIQKYRLEFG